MYKVTVMKFLAAYKEIQCMPIHVKYKSLEMWANAQRDGRPAEHRWRALFNAA